MESMFGVFDSSNWKKQNEESSKYSAKKKPSGLGSSKKRSHQGELKNQKKHITIEPEPSLEEKRDSECIVNEESQDGQTLERFKNFERRRELATGIENERTFSKKIKNEPENSLNVDSSILSLLDGIPELEESEPEKKKRKKNGKEEEEGEDDFVDFFSDGVPDGVNPEEIESKVSKPTQREDKQTSQALAAAIVDSICVRGKKTAEEVKKASEEAKKRNYFYNFKPELVYDFTVFRNRPVIKTVCHTNEKELRFFFMGAEYRYDQWRGTKVILFGNVWGTHHSCAVVLLGFKPHMFLSIPSAWYHKDASGKSTIAMWIIRDFLEHMEKLLKNDYKWKGRDKDDIDSMSKVIVDFSVKDAVDMEDYYELNEEKPVRDDGRVNLRKKVTKFINVTCNFPKAIGAIRYIVSNPGNFEWPYKTLQSEGQLVMNILEGDVDFASRYITDNRFTPCTWFYVKGYDYTALQHGDRNKMSTCDREIVCHYTKLKPTSDPEDNNKLCNWQICTLDGEMSAPGRFPRADRGDPVVVISVCLTSYLERDEQTFFIFSKADKEEYVFEKEKNRHVYTFKKEEGVLKAWYDFCVQVDVDIFQTYNGDAFDYDYFWDRGCHYFGAEYRTLGRMLYFKSNVFKKAWRGRINHTANIPGRTNIDFCKRVKADPVPGVKMTDFRLNTVSNTLLGKKKTELNITLLAKKMETVEGRKQVWEYATMDVVLPEEISKKLNTIPTYIGLARISNITFQRCIDRAIGAKIEGGLLRERFKGEIPIIKRSRFLMDKENKGPQGMYENTDDLVFELTDKCSGKVEGAQLLEPKIGEYPGYIGTMDFASMYPSIMQKYNLCLSTLISEEKIKKWGLKRDADYFKLPKYDFLSQPGKVIVYDDPEGACFLSRDLLPGVLPEVERELGILRSKFKADVKVSKAQSEAMDHQVELLKKELAKVPTDPTYLNERVKMADNIKSVAQKGLDFMFKAMLADGSQLGIKNWMNGIFGQTIFESSKYYKEEIGKTILKLGKYLINYVKLLIEIEYPIFNPTITYKPSTLYGDTDSALTYLDGFVGTPEEALAEFKTMTKFVNSHFVGSEPLNMSLDKLYDFFILVSGKNYTGNLIWAEGNWLKDGVVEVKGLRYKKKGPPTSFKDLCEDATDLHVRKKKFNEAIEIIRGMIIRLIKRKVTVSDLVFTNNYNKDPSYPLWKYMSKLKQAGVKIPKDVEKTINDHYKASDDAKKKKKKEPRISAPVIHNYKMLCKDSGKWVDRGDTLYYVFHEPDVVKSKLERIDKVKISELTMDPVEMIENEIPYNVDYYVEALIKLTMKFLAFHCGDTEVTECPKYREVILGHPSVAGLKKRPHRKFSSVDVGSTNIRKGSGNAKISTIYNFVATVKTVCVMCRKEFKEKEAKLVLQDGIKALCSSCAENVDLGYYSVFLRSRTAEKEKLDQEKWDICKKCLGDDKLNPMDCIDATCHNFSSRLDTKRKVLVSKKVLEKTDDFLTKKIIEEMRLLAIEMAIIKKEE